MLRRIISVLVLANFAILTLNIMQYLLPELYSYNQLFFTLYGVVFGLFTHQYFRFIDRFIRK